MKLKKAYFMARRLLTDLVENRKIITCISKDRELREYYLVFESEKVNSRGGNKPFKFDSEGVPQIHSYIDVEEAKGYYYYPITIGQYALAIFHDYLSSGSSESRDHFLRMAKWFQENAIEENNAVFWITEVPKPEFDMHQPWKSAFSQSRGISVLLRAWQIDQDPHKLDTCRRALTAFDRDVSNGGVRVDHEEGRTFYEEYVAKKPTRILDGHMFSLFGLYDFVRSQRGVDHPTTALAQSLFEDGIQGLEKWLPDFDMGFWVHYNQCDIEGYPPDDPCTLGYLRLVSCQLEILSSLSGSRTLDQYARRFRNYLQPKNILKSYQLKVKTLKSLNRL